MLPTSLVTVPLPRPASCTVKMCSTSKVAVTAWVWSIVTPHACMPVHPAPFQPVKMVPAARTAPNVTTVCSR